MSKTKVVFIATSSCNSFLRVRRNGFAIFIYHFALPSSFKEDISVYCCCVPHCHLHFWCRANRDKKNIKIKIWIKSNDNESGQNGCAPRRITKLIYANVACIISIVRAPRICNSIWHLPQKKLLLFLAIFFFFGNTEKCIRMRRERIEFAALQR